ncbi:MAG: hypothetical protein HYW70_02805 [Candidatus Nealsonbacteria bacterium]|nr:hypothetical protein [Candidatus Nealsonbacteria bacterium]
MLQILDPEGKIVDGMRFDELKMSSETLFSIYKTMLLTRFFEERMVLESRLGKLPLYISPKGQEAAEVASTFAMDSNDVILWYKRSQGAAFARGVSVEGMARLFYGLNRAQETAEFLNRSLMIPYSLVGIHLPHAVGYGLALKILKQQRIAAAFFGDGATSQGAFHSALNWASIFKTPTVFICENNQYAITESNAFQTATRTFAEKANAYNMSWGVADGNDVFAMYAVAKEAARRARTLFEPTLIEAVTYRMDPHTTAIGDIISISEEDKERAKINDPLRRLQLFFMGEQAKKSFAIQWDLDKDALLRKEIDSQVASSIKQVDQLFETAQKGPLFQELLSLNKRCYTKNIDQQKLDGCSFFVPDAIANASVRDAINFAYYDVMRADDAVVTLGEDVGMAGSVFRTVALPELFVKEYLAGYSDKVLQKFLPLQSIFGKDRVIDTPLDELGICGVSIGMALAGFRPIAEIQFSGFVFEGAGQIISEMARMKQRSEGELSLPIMIRLPYGGGRYIEHHREFEAPHFLNSPGITIVCPSLVQDFYDLFWASVFSGKPVLYFEDKNLYRSIAAGNLKRRVPEKTLEQFGARLAKEGKDVTVTAYGRLVYDCLEAAKELEKENISLEVIDLRIISPLDTAAIHSSVKKTGRLVTVQEEPRFFGTSAEIGTSVFESDAFFSLRAPIKRVAPPWVYHPNHIIWDLYIPQKEQILLAAREIMKA